jgi:hypothetical protein
MSNYEPEAPADYEDELRARTYSYEMSWLEHEIRKAERDYHTLVKKAGWSDDDCAEADAIQRFIAAHHAAIAEMQAAYEAGAR